MTNRLVYHDDLDGSFKALDPAKATGVAIPAFAIGNALPAAGQTVGEGYLVAPTRTGYLWDGNRWLPIVPSALLNYATDAAVFADTAQQAGSYAVSNATGNLFVSLGGGRWKQQGIRTYTTEATLLADTTAVDSSVGYAVDTGLHYARVGAAWRPMSIRQFANEAAMRAKTTGNLNGQIAVTLLENKIYLWDGSRWTGNPFSYYATEAALLVATEADGVLAIAGDTSVPFIRTAGTWNRLAGATMTSGITAPASAATGDMFYNVVEKKLYVRGSTTWDAVSGGATVAATAPATPQTGQLWYDTTGQELKTWNGTAWVNSYGDFNRIAEGHYRIETTGTTPAHLELYNGGSPKNAGILTRDNAGPVFWTQQSDLTNTNFMEVDINGAVTFPHSRYAILAAKKNVNWHPGAANVWEDQSYTITNLASYVPVGHLYKIEVSVKAFKYHDGNLYLAGKIETAQGVVDARAGWARIDKMTEHTTSSHMYLSDINTVTDASGIASITLRSFGEGGQNGDRQIWGEILIWDLGLATNVPDFS